MAASKFSLKSSLIFSSAWVSSSLSLTLTVLFFLLFLLSSSQCFFDGSIISFWTSSLSTSRYNPFSVKVTGDESVYVNKSLKYKSLIAKLNLKLNSLYVLPVCFDFFSSTEYSAIWSSISAMRSLISERSNWPPASCNTFKIGLIKYAILPSEDKVFKFIINPSILIC